MKNHCPADDIPTAAPWLVFTDPGKEEEQFFYNLFERPPYNKIHKRSIPEMNPAWFRYFQSPSHQGWLIVYCHLNEQYPESWRLKCGDCFLLDPESLKKIWLPSLNSWITRGHEVGVRGGVLSGPPTINNDSLIFFLLIIITDKFDVENIIVFCRPGDKEWRSQMLPELVIPLSITCFKGKLHLLCERPKNIDLIVIEKQVGSDDDEMSLSVTITAFPVVAKDKLTFSSYHEIKFLESRHELFVVVVDYHQLYLTTPYRYEDITGFQVFRMNFSLMILEKVKSLGDHVLFLGGRTTASCCADDLGLTRGQLYFTMPKDKTVYVLDIEDGTISFDIGFSDSTETCFQQAEWFAMPASYIRGNCKVNANEAVIVEAESNIKPSVQGNNDKSECREKTYEGGNEIIKSSGTSWDSLDMDIVELIASYLHIVDYLHFRAVCKVHRSAARIVRKRTTLEISHTTTSLSPWMILHQNNEDCVYRFINPMHSDEAYFLNLSDFLLDATIHCSEGGWMLMSQSCQRNFLFFFNPFTRDTVRLPEMEEEWRNFQGISFSSIPTSSDCKVFAIGRPHCCNIILTSFISRGDDLWRFDQHKEAKAHTIEEENLMFNFCRTNPVFHNGGFYCLGTRGNLGVFEIHNSEHSWKVLDDLEPVCTCYRQSFLVECDGQLLSVYVTPLNKTRPVQIFKLHASKKTSRNLVWVEVEDLGKYMLFVSHTCCIAAIAPVSRMKNKIYIPRLHNNRIVFYSLDTCRYQTLFLSDSTDQYSSSSNGFYSTKKHLYSAWIEPNWSGTTTTGTELVW